MMSLLPYTISATRVAYFLFEHAECVLHNDLILYPEQFVDTPNHPFFDDFQIDLLDIDLVNRPEGDLEVRMLLL